MTAVTRKKMVVRTPEQVKASAVQDAPAAPIYHLSPDDALWSAPQMSLAEMQAAHEEQVALRKENNKVAISLRVEPDVLDWFKAQGSGHLTKMNQVLKAFVEAQKNR